VTDQAPQERASTPSFLTRFQGLPPWVQAGGAIVGAVIAIGGFVITLNRPETPRALADPELFPSYTVGAQGLEASGRYVDLAPARQIVVFQAKPPGATVWQSVKAVLSPDPDTAGQDLQEGTWTARIPVTESEGWEMQSFIVNGGVSSGAQGGVLDDIRKNGAESDLVVFASEVVQVE
jgi:hypothetical protein